jgi:phosphatidylglycerophosphate synthase
MTAALWLLAILGVVGAFDTLYYHEWKAKLPAGVPETAQELRLHAARDFFYAILFAALPWVAWQGYWVIALIAVIIIEIVLTLWDFVEEIAARKILGDVYAGERVTHAIMGIIYGAMAANLIPTLIAWWKMPTTLLIQPAPVPEWLRWSLLLMAAGVFMSGIRDLYAAFGLPNAGWPWKRAS